MLTEAVTLWILPQKEEVTKLPTTTGIYIFRTAKEILYIGKSVNLRARIASHLENARLDAKEAAIVSNATQIDCIITDSEFKALLLESRLIQKYLPPYNSIWRDDKSYLYVKITIHDEYPKIFPVRKENDNHSLYFGPFPSLRTVEEILKEVRKVFPFCTSKRINKHPCFYSKIGLCYPCPNSINSIEDTKTKSRLKKMYRYNIRQIIKVFNGKVELVLKNLYQQLKDLSAQGSYEEALILRNTIYRFERLIRQRLFLSDIMPNYNQAQESLDELRQLLTPYFPHLGSLHRIECYDISTLSLQEATASMVVLTDGLIDKSQYRKFKIKNLRSHSDFEMMNEVIRRRSKNTWENPDLMVVDGGRPQIRVAKKILRELAIDIPLIGIAKHPDRLIGGQGSFPVLKPAPTHLGFNLVRLIRDESHRFAKKYHLFLRDKKFFSSS